MVMVVFFYYTAYFRWCFAAAWAVVEPPLDECWRGGGQLSLVAGVRGDISCRRHPYQHVAGHVGLEALLVRSGDKSSLGLGVDRLRWMVFAGWIVFPGWSSRAFLRWIISLGSVLSSRGSVKFLFVWCWFLHWCYIDVLCDTASKISLVYQGECQVLLVMCCICWIIMSLIRLIGIALFTRTYLKLKFSCL